MLVNSFVLTLLLIQDLSQRRSKLPDRSLAYWGAVGSLAKDSMSCVRLGNLFADGKQHSVVSTCFSSQPIQGPQISFPFSPTSFRKFGPSSSGILITSGGSGTSSWSNTPAGVSPGICRECWSTPTPPVFARTLGSLPVLTGPDGVAGVILVESVTVC